MREKTSIDFVSFVYFKFCQRGLHFVGVYKSGHIVFPTVQSSKAIKVLRYIFDRNLGFITRVSVAWYEPSNKQLKMYWQEHICKGDEKDRKGEGRRRRKSKQMNDWNTRTYTPQLGDQTKLAYHSFRSRRNRGCVFLSTFVFGFCFCLFKLRNLSMDECANEQR